LCRKNKFIFTRLCNSSSKRILFHNRRRNKRRSNELVYLHENLPENKIIEKYVEDNETTYFLTERGKRLQNIIYELAIFNVEEEYSGSELEQAKKELEKLKRK